MNKIAATILYLIVSLSAWAEVEYTTLESKDGRSIRVILKQKKATSIVVEREGGKEMLINFELLSEDSQRIVSAWEDPNKRLFEALNKNRNFVFIEGKGDPKETERFMGMCKEYGIYSEFGDEGLPEGSMSLASLFFALEDYKYQKECAEIIHKRYTGSHGGSIGWSGQGTTTKYIGVEMSQTAKVWPKELPEYAIEDFRYLQRAFLELSQQIEARDNSGSDNPYFISEEVRKYNKRILGLLKPYEEQLNSSQN